MALKKYGVMQQCEAQYNRAKKTADEDTNARIICEEAEAVAQAVHAIQGLCGAEARKLREEFHDFLDGGEAQDKLRLQHDRQVLNTFSPLWWVHAFTDLFFSGDFSVPRGISLRRWLKVLIRRVDFAGWAQSKEFAVAGYNLCLRRAQMWAIHRYCDRNTTFQKKYTDLATLSP